MHFKRIISIGGILTHLKGFFPLFYVRFYRMCISVYLLTYIALVCIVFTCFFREFLWPAAKSHCYTCKAFHQCGTLNVFSIRLPHWKFWGNGNILFCCFWVLLVCTFLCFFFFSHFVSCALYEWLTDIQHYGEFFFQKVKIKFVLILNKNRWFILK